MAGFDLSNYEPVEERIPKFWTDHPKGRMVTELRPAPAGEWVVYAALFREGEQEPFSTGLAHEVTGQGNVNRTSALENCETSAIGRALANAGYAPRGARPSRQEMQKARGQDRSGGPPVCAVCKEPAVEDIKKQGDGYVHKRCAEADSGRPFTKDDAA